MKQMCLGKLLSVAILLHERGKDFEQGVSSLADSDSATMMFRAPARNAPAKQTQSVPSSWYVCPPLPPTSNRAWISTNFWLCKH